MGQCLSRPRSRPKPRARSRPLCRPIKVAPIVEIRCEMVKDESRSARDYDVNQGKPPTLTGLPRIRNNSVRPVKLPPLHNPPQVFLPYMYHQRKKKVPKKVCWNEKELSKAEDHVEVKHSARGEQANGQAIKALVRDVTGNVEVIEVKPIEVAQDDSEWHQLIDENNRRRSNAAKLAQLAVSRQIFGSSEKDTHVKKVNKKEPEKPFKQPFWKLGDVPVGPVVLPSIEDIENEMKTIESQMQALLKPEEKNQKRSVAFTIGKMETARSQTPGCVPQRLLKHQKAEVDRMKILEKQREAERRRNVSIAKRVQSAKRRGKNAPAKREKERQQHEKDIQMKVDLKMKAAANRRNDILTQRASAAKKQTRTELVNDREKVIADDHKSKQQVKSSKTSENRERMMRRKLRSLKFQEKKRQLARERLAREKHEEEERCHTIIETETYNGDEDLGEHDWD